MILSLIVSILASSFGTQPDAVPTEAAISTDGQILAMIVNEESMDGTMWAFVDGEEPLASKRGHFHDRVGPTMWGIIGDEYYAGAVRKSFSQWYWTVVTNSVPINAQLRYSRSAIRGPLDDEARDEIMTRRAATARYITPIQEKFNAYTGDSSDFPPFFCDVIHLENNNVFTFAVTEGELIHWTNKRPEEDWLEWTERARVETDIDSPLRIQRAGENIYLIDEDGIVYSTPAPPKNRHERIGRISGWSGVLHGEELIILEDHAREKIGFFKVPVEGAVIPLIFEGHSDAAPDFHDKVPTPELEETLHEMAVIIRENRSDKE